MVDVNQNVSLVRGQTKFINVTIRDEETGAPYVLTTDSTIWQLLDSRTSTTPVLQYTRTSGITWTQPSQGKLRIELQGSQTDLLEIKHYYHALWVRNGSTETLALEGRLEVKLSGPGI